jgi:hypothetical protein
MTTEQPTQFTTEVSPDALGKLFNADPEELSNTDLQIICEELRRQRNKFELTEAASAMKQRTPRATKSITTDAAQQLSLEDLGL